MLPSPSHYVDLLANVHPIFHHVTLQKYQHRALFISVTKTLRFQHCQWHKGRTNAAFPQALKFIPNQEQWYCKCEGAFNQSRQSSNTANQLEKKSNKGITPPFMALATLKPFYHTTFPGQLNPDWWTFLLRTVNMTTIAKQQDIISGTKFGCWKENWWCSGSLKAIKYPIKVPR